MVPYIKLFQKHQNLHLEKNQKSVTDKNCKISHPPKKDKTLIRSPQKETKTPEFFTTHIGKIIKNRKEDQ
jgi:hypothetical protein